MRKVRSLFQPMSEATAQKQPQSPVAEGSTIHRKECAQYVLVVSYSSMMAINKRMNQCDCSMPHLKLS